MKTKFNYFYILIITLLISLLIFGYLLNKRSSASKKNEISNILQQLKTRNIQISKIQKNLFKNGKNINDLINEKKINFKKVFENKELANFKEYSSSKYTTNDILFNEKRQKVIEHNYTLLYERVRDIIVSKDKKTVIIFLETSSSLLILERI